MKACKSSNKNGGFYFYSRDRFFIIKTIFEPELKNLIKNLEEYVQHLEKYPNSLIARIYGIYQIKLKGADPVNFILMNNCVVYQNKLCFKKYQLRGVLNEERNVQKQENDGFNYTADHILKDQNFMNMK